MTRRGRWPADGSPVTPSHGFSTRRRLVAAFSFVLVAFLVALVFQVFVLRRMEATFATMEEHDEQMQLALQLESEVREQYSHEPYAARDVGRLAAYERARDRSLELGRTLSARVDEADAVLWMKEIRQASAELDQLFRDRAAHVQIPVAADMNERAYSLVSLIEQNVDRTFARLQVLNSRSRQELVDLKGSALQLIGVLLVVIPAFVVGAVLYLSRSIARPLARLSFGAAAIAGGDLDTRIDIASPDEFGALASEFNGMTTALKQHQRKLVEAEKLAAIGRLAAGVAHELNNPLQVMLGYLSLNRDLPDRRLAQQLAAAEAEALRCKQVVESLLELSRPTLTSAAVDLKALCVDVAAGLRFAVHGGLDLAMDGEALALGDPIKIRQVLFNLIKNAEEAAGPGGRVEVRIRADGGQVEVVVTDNGPGISVEARARLFEPFFTTKPSGTGLGLAVSRAIALAHGGDVDVGPLTGQSGGAAFTLRLPRDPGRST